ncbi:hypothetical protein T09_6848 [Trichinella sp. T9]|nr:hypothetical protein T09_6848 [Trichinella sp. T9]
MQIRLFIKYTAILSIQREQSHQESKATFSHEAFTRSCLGYEFGDSDCMIRSEAKYQLKFRKAGKLASYLCKSGNKTY